MHRRSEYFAHGFSVNSGGGEGVLDDGSGTCRSYHAVASDVTTARYFFKEHLVGASDAKASSHKASPTGERLFRWTLHIRCPTRKPIGQAVRYQALCSDYRAISD